MADRYMILVDRGRLTQRLLNPKADKLEDVKELAQQQIIKTNVQTAEVVFQGETIVKYVKSED